MTYTINCHTQFHYAHVIYRPFTMLTLTAALHCTERPSWLAYQMYLVTQQYSFTKNTYRWKEIKTPFLVEWAPSTSPQPPKPNRILNHKQEPNSSFTHDMSQHPLNPLLCSRTCRPRSAGWSPPQNSKSSPRKLKSGCVLSPQKENRRKLVMSIPLSLSLFLFSQSSGDSPRAESSRRNQFISA
jgi:hypothetical protein